MTYVELSGNLAGVCLKQLSVSFTIRLAIL